MTKYLLVAFLFVFWGCGKKKDLEVPEERPIEGNYYPIGKGEYRIYEVKQSTFPTGIRLDSVYKVKEVFADTFADIQGGISYKIARFRTKPPVDTFSLDSVWYVKVSSNGIVKTENNIPLLKLSEPLLMSKTWNGNQYNTYAAEYYKINRAGAYKNYAEVIEVTQRDDSSLLRRDLRKEIYARDLGMVYKLTRTLNFSSSGADFGQGVIVGGIIKEQVLVGHGR